ncbi:MAG: hypothetical protein PHT38_02525 [Halothiobacillus sp.]|nr:hypothetical protein [Halothiobacillus sp.]
MYSHFWRIEMGSTVTTGKKAATFSDNLGRNFYVLFEQTYEKNCYPHTPHWGAIAFGEIETVLTRIFGTASNAEGGLLQGRSGPIKPEGYVQSWMDELKSPAVIDVNNVVHISLKDITTIFSGEPTEQEKRESFLSELDRADFPRHANALRECGETTVDIYFDADVISLFCRFAPAWRVFGPSFMSGHILEDGGYSPKKSKDRPSIKMPGLYKSKKDLHGNIRFIGEKEEGVLSFIDDRFGVIGMFVKEYAPFEISNPGHFSASTKALRDHLENLPETPESMMLYFDPAKVKAWYWKEQVEKAARVVGDGVCLDQVPPEQMHHLSSLFPEAVTLKIVEQSTNARRLEQTKLAFA